MFVTNSTIYSLFEMTTLALISDELWCELETQSGTQITSRPMKHQTAAPLEWRPWWWQIQRLNCTDAAKMKNNWSSWREKQKFTFTHTYRGFRCPNFPHVHLIWPKWGSRWTQREASQIVHIALTERASTCRRNAPPSLHRWRPSGSNDQRDAGSNCLHVEVKSPWARH